MGRRESVICSRRSLVAPEPKEPMISARRLVCTSDSLIRSGSTTTGLLLRNALALLCCGRPPHTAKIKMNDAVLPAIEMQPHEEMKIHKKEVTSRHSCPTIEPQ